MRRFEYAQPRSEAEAVKLLAESKKETVVLAGGTDLVGLMKRMVVTPGRVVNIMEIDSLKHLEQDSQGGVCVGAAVCLDEFLFSALTDCFVSAKQIIEGISSLQLQSQGTMVGELLRRPGCWYFRDGHGLLADRGQMVLEGDNRYHAILGNRGAAKFVSASRLAPALISLRARVRVLGPDPEQETFLPVEELFQVPVDEHDRENTLRPGQLVTHLLIPAPTDQLSAAYEIRHGEGPDQPLASAAVNLAIDSGRVQHAHVVLGQVAPTPWVARYSEQSLLGQPVTEDTASRAATEAVVGAVALTHNEYKIQLAQVAVKRALLKAAGLETGGLDRPMTSQPASSSSQPTHLA